MQQVIHLKTKVTFFHRNLKAGYSINKVTQTIISHFDNKVEFYIPHYRVTLGNLLSNLFFVYKHRDINGINHVTGGIHYGILALIGCKSVLTIHDTDLYDNTPSGVKRFLFCWFWFKLPLRFATRVICISSQTKRNVERFTKRKDIITIYNALDLSLKEYPLRVFDEKTGWRILVIGTSYNKNVERTIKAVSGIDCTLIIIGKLNPMQLEILLNEHVRYINKYDLSDEEIYQEYCKCDMVSFCSLYEGFGMPIIEANRVGRPVISSNIEPLVEVAANAALLIDPYNIEAIRKGILRLMNDEVLRNELVRNGKLNAKRFSVDKIANEYRQLYDSIISE